MRKNVQKKAWAKGLSLNICVTVSFSILSKYVTGTTMSGNKMDTTNLATLFAPSLMHTFKEEGVKPGVIHGNVAASVAASTCGDIAARCGH